MNSEGTTLNKHTINRTHEHEFSKIGNSQKSEKGQSNFKKSIPGFGQYTSIGDPRHVQALKKSVGGATVSSSRHANIKLESRLDFDPPKDTPQTTLLPSHIITYIDNYTSSSNSSEQYVVEADTKNETFRIEDDSNTARTEGREKREEKIILPTACDNTAEKTANHIELLSKLQNARNSALSAECESHHDRIHHSKHQKFEKENNSSISENGSNSTLDSIDTSSTPSSSATQKLYKYQPNINIKI